MTFQLEAFNPDEALPENARLNEPEDLVGHKIVAVIYDCVGRQAAGGEMLIVTETGCWIVLAPTNDPEYPAIVVDRGYAWPTLESAESIIDYASADQLLRARLITKAQRDYLRAEEQKREDEKKAKRAAALRAELAKLESAA